MFPHMIGEFSSHRLPHLAAPRTLEVTTRYQNFSRAVGELHLKHGAASHQIKALERDLGVMLFDCRNWTDRPYYMAYPDHIEPSPRLLIFRDLLLEQVKPLTSMEGKHATQNT
jgi:Bacterial regulatory helix-turn-helix protein, lysR family